MSGCKTLATCLVALTLFPVAANSKDTFENEPFDTFRLIDAEMTRLDSQLAQLKKSLRPGGQLSAKQRRLWVASARRMRATASSIQRLGKRMRSHYRAHHQKAGYRLFTALDLKAQALRHQLLSLERARGRVVAERASSRVEKSMLALVLQFDSMSGGYAAVHCEPQWWACAEVRSDRANDAPAVKWACVNTRRACAGLLGPQSPARVPHVVQRSPVSK